MTLQEFKDWADIISKLALPFVLAWLGLLLTRGLEVRKAEVTRSSQFNTKWADSFFDTAHDFMKSTERYMAILFQLQLLKNPDAAWGTKLQEEANDLNVRLGELGLRIERLAYFAERNGHQAIQASKAVQAYLTQVVAPDKEGKREGSFDRLASLENSFNQAVRAAHAEMLRIQ